MKGIDMTVLEEVRTRQNSKRQQRSEAYRQLVQDYAVGNENDPAEVEDILDDVGRTVDQLAADGTVLEERIDADQAIQNAEGLIPVAA